MVDWKRVLRTPSSERFLAVKAGKDAAAIDLHYLPDGHVAGTVIILDGAGLTEKDAPELLRALDNDLLPGVDVGSGSVVFTVVVGRFVGSFEGAEEK